MLEIKNCSWHTCRVEVTEIESVNLRTEQQNLPILNKKKKLEKKKKKAEQRLKGSWAITNNSAFVLLGSYPRKREVRERTARVFRAFKGIIVESFSNLV